MRALKIAVWTVGLSLIAVLSYIAHENRERAIRGRYIADHINVGLTIPELEKILGQGVVIRQATSDPRKGYIFELDKTPGGLYRAGYQVRCWFDPKKKLGYYEMYFNPVWGEVELSSSSIK